MKYQKKVSVGSFLKKGEDIKDDDIIKLASEGKQVQGEFGTQNVFLVKLKNGKEGNLGINQTSINGFIDAWGEDSINWIGKEIKVWKVKQNVSGKFVDVYYFSHPDAEMTEDGFIMPINPKERVNVKDDDIPVIEENDINVKDIPM